MKKNISILALAMLLFMPCVLHAEEIEIQLMEVVDMGFIPGDNPLDGPNQDPSVPTRPNDFRATINGNSLTVLKQEASIPSAQAIVVNASTGTPVINEQFTNSLSRQIATSGIYVLRIETAGGALIGQFVVQ